MKKQKLFFVIKDDQDKICFAGTRGACFGWLVQGDNYLHSSTYTIISFTGDVYKTISTKR